MLSRKAMIVYWIFLALSVFFIFLVRVMTFTYHGSVSGNGNPGMIPLLLGWATLIVLIPMMYVAAVRYFDSFKDHIAILSYQLVLPWLAFAGMIISLWLEIVKIRATSLTLHGFSRHPDSVIYRFGAFNSYTNDLYFNPYILLFTLSFAISAGWFTVKKRRF